MQNLTCTRCGKEYELGDLELWQIRMFGPDFCPKCMDDEEEKFSRLEGIQEEEIQP